MMHYVAIAGQGYICQAIMCKLLVLTHVKRMLSCLWVFVSLLSQSVYQSIIAYDSCFMMLYYDRLVISICQSLP